MLMRSDSERGLEFAQIGGEGLEPVSQLIDLGANRGDLGGPGRRQSPRPTVPRVRPRPAPVLPRRRRPPRVAAKARRTFSSSSGG